MSEFWACCLSGGSSAAVATHFRAAGTIAAILLGQRSVRNESGNKEPGGLDGSKGLGVGPSRHIKVGHNSKPDLAGHAWRLSRQ